MSILSIHSFIVLILYILAVVGLNDFLLGVDDGYKFYRGFGLVTEPSYSSVISLVTAIFYFKKRAAIFSVSSVAFFLTFSGTAAISLLIVLIIWFVLSFGNWRLWLFLPVFIAVVFLIAHYNLVGFYEYQVARIVESLNIVVSGGDISSLEYSNPRLMNFFNAIMLFQSYTLAEITFGKGVGSLIFLVGVLKGTINFYPFQFIAEGGWVMVVFHLVSSLWLFLTIKGIKSRLIIVAIFSYWLINGGALFYMYYVLGPLLYYSKEGAESV